MYFENIAVGDGNAEKIRFDRREIWKSDCDRQMRSDNNSGFRGVFKKKNGRYSVTIGFKKKIYFIGCYEDYEDAVQARLIAEKKIHGAFLRANEIWQEKYLQDPEWGEKNPLVFEVSKENGVLIVRNSMESFMKPAQKMMKFADGTSFRKRPALHQRISSWTKKWQ